MWNDGFYRFSVLGDKLWYSSSEEVRAFEDCELEVGLGSDFNRKHGRLISIFLTLGTPGKFRRKNDLSLPHL